TVIDAMYRAFNQEMRKITDGDILSALNAQVPLSVSQREVVASLRAWLSEGRAVSASAEETRRDDSSQIRLDPIDEVQ
ncbi:MAG: hypothetical protein KC400_06435, partial [Methanolinea sp.]|nr:hypothetical protein [Methanolinea sp.]